MFSTWLARHVYSTRDHTKQWPYTNTRNHHRCHTRKHRGSTRRTRDLGLPEDHAWNQDQLWQVPLSTNLTSKAVTSDFDIRIRHVTNVHAKNNGFNLNVCCLSWLLEKTLCEPLYKLWFPRAIITIQKHCMDLDGSLACYAISRNFGGIKRWIERTHL